MDIIEVNFWIKSRKFMKKLSLKMVDKIMKELKDDKLDFIMFQEDEVWRMIANKDITEIQFSKKDYLLFKQVEKEKRKKREEEKEEDEEKDEDIEV